MHTDVIHLEIVQLQQRLVKIVKRALVVVFVAVQLEIDHKRQQTIVKIIASNTHNRNKIHNRVRFRYFSISNFHFLFSSPHDDLLSTVVLHNYFCFSLCSISSNKSSINHNKSGKHSQFENLLISNNPSSIILQRHAKVWLT